MNKEVFISHSGRDRQTAEQICRHLEEHDINCWIAPRDIPYGDAWAADITSAIKNSRLFVFLLSKNSNESRQCPKEIAIADSAGIPVLCLKIETVEMNPSYEYHFSVAQIMPVDFSAPETALEEIETAVKGRLGHIPPVPHTSVNAFDTKEKAGVPTVKYSGKKPHAMLEIALSALVDRGYNTAASDLKYVMDLLKFSKPFATDGDSLVLQTEADICTEIDTLLLYTMGEDDDRTQEIKSSIAKAKQKAVLRNTLLKK